MGTGKRLPTGGISQNRQKHPRGYGEENCRQPFLIQFAETPPWVRGRASKVSSDETGIGNTPVGTGKSTAIERTLENFGKHPRGYGEEPSSNTRNAQSIETPPWVRGRDPMESKMQGKERNTPVGTGKRSLRLGWRQLQQKHPRGYGEESDGLCRHCDVRETPPWVRGRVMLHLPLH